MGEGNHGSKATGQWNRRTCIGRNKYFDVAGTSDRRQDIVDDETREEGVVTSWRSLNII